MPEAETWSLGTHEVEEFESHRSTNLRHHCTLFESHRTLFEPHVFDRLTRHHRIDCPHWNVVTANSGWEKGQAASRPISCQGFSPNASRARKCQAFDVALHQDCFGSNHSSGFRMEGKLASARAQHHRRHPSLPRFEKGVWQCKRGSLRAIDLA